MDWVYIILVFFASAAIAALVMPQIIHISYTKKLFDKPDHRKVHIGTVPRLGGVAFLPAIIMSMSLLTGIYLTRNGDAGVRYLLDPGLALGICALTLIYFEGVADDLTDIGYRAKFCCQFVCAAMMVGSGLWLKDLYGLFGIHELPAVVGMPVSVLFIVYIINAINLIDGIDGLASGLSIMAFLFFGTLYFLWGAFIYAALAFSVLGALAVFFVYNVFGSIERRQKIFMGDCGSQCIGLLLALLTIRLTLCPQHEAGVRSDAFIMAASALLVPCFDLIRVMFGRIRRGTNPFLPDKTHIHHKLMALGMGPHSTLCAILLVALFFLVLNFGLLHVVDANILLAIDIVLWTAGHVWLSRRIRKKSAH